MSHESHLQSKDYFDDTASVYHKRSDGLVYDFSSLIFKRRNAIVRSFLPPSYKKEIILDFGMGPGVFAKYSTENGFSYIGIDISSEMVERARALKLENTKFEVGDIESLKNLHLWDKFERQNPNSFREMYQFWTRKLIK